MAVCPTISGAASKSRNFPGSAVQIIAQTFRRTIKEENHSCDRPVVAALVSNASTSLDRCWMFGVRCFLGSTQNAQRSTSNAQWSNKEKRVRGIESPVSVGLFIGKTAQKKALVRTSRQKTSTDFHLRLALCAGVAQTL